jgi:hypothetical protein
VPLIHDLYFLRDARLTNGGRSVKTMKILLDEYRKHLTGALILNPAAQSAAT